MTSGNTQTATYHWLADGTKYQVEDASGNGVIYAGDLTYAVTVSGGNTTYALESAEASADGTARFLKNGTTMTPYYTIRDHLGSVRTIVNASGTVVERNDYYPFGTRTTFGTSYATLATNRQKFSGKEDQSTIASSSLPYLDFGARMYDSKLVRWNTYDPMAEKYCGINPYVVILDDPVRFIDFDGREVRVANEYQKQFKNDLHSVFGEKANRFSFNENGKLQLEGKTTLFTRGLTKDQKGAFKGLNKAMKDKQITSVVYENRYSITIGKETKTVDIVNDYGGGLYSKEDNLIVVAPNVGTITVQTEPERNAIGDYINLGGTAVVEQNTTSTLFHEIGERNTPSSILQRGVVVDYENYVRRIIGLPNRPYDLQGHSKNTQTIIK